MKNNKFSRSYIPLVLSLILLSQSLFAKSINHITAVKTVGQNAILTEKGSALAAPQLIITLTDGLKEGDRFYLHLKDAVWNEKVQMIQCPPTESEAGTPANTIVSHQLSDTEMEIIVEAGNLAPGTQLTIPLETTVKGEQAEVTIESNNTSIVSETLVFANISSAKVNVLPVEPSEKVLEEGFLPKLEIEECYGGQIRHFENAGADHTFILRLDNPEFTFEITQDASLVGTKAFEGIVGDASAFKLLNSTQLQVTLPETVGTIDSANKGSFFMDGIKIKTTSREPKSQSVSVSVEGNMVNNTTFQGLALGDFIVHLTTPDPTTSLAGTKQKVTFTLEEDIKDSLLRNRPIIVTLDHDVHPTKQADGTVPVVIEGETYFFESIMEDDRCIGFTIPSLTYDALKDKTKIVFSFDTVIPASARGKVNLHLEGRALHEPLTATVFDVQSPVTVAIDGFKVQSGLKDQFGGSIYLTEYQAGTLIQGKKLFISLDTDSLQVTTTPIVTVTEGDLRVGSPLSVPGGIEIPILSQSTVPSTLAIKHFGLTLNGSVATGKYEVAVGGTALSVLSGPSIDMTEGFPHIDPVIVHDQFVLVNTDVMEKRVITFKIGEASYGLNGVYHHLDTPAYIENGRVMVPIRYVAEALGIAKDKMKYDEKTRTFTLYADKVIEVTVGSNAMYVEGIATPMDTTTQQNGADVMVPMSAIANALGVETTWDKALETATFIQYGQ